MKKVLITAGPVYGKLDDNKIVSNRSRGIWAINYAQYLHNHTEHEVILLIPDLMKKQVETDLWAEINAGRLIIRTHSSFQDYAAICETLATNADAAIMAAAVVNYIPETPFPGKMKTDKQRIEIPFILAPRVINRMKKRNPRLTLIGCKLLFSGDMDTLIDAAYHVVLAARCNAVVANDAKLGLRAKHIVHQDRCVVTYDDDFPGFYQHLTSLIEDVHYRTGLGPKVNGMTGHKKEFQTITDRWRNWFTHRVKGEPFVFGSVAVRNTDPGVDGVYIVSPREKGQQFGADDAVVIQLSDAGDRVVKALTGFRDDPPRKATLNAPLLVRHLERYPEAAGVVHIHERTGVDNDIPIPLGLPNPESFPRSDYAPPGTARDNEREIPGPIYLIPGHGWIIAVDDEGQPLPHARVHDG